MSVMYTTNTLGTKILGKKASKTEIITTFLTNNYSTTVLLREMI